MKKLLFFVGAVVISSSVFAQRPVDSNPFSLEGGLSLNTTSNTFNAPMLKLRYFATENIAARVGLQYNSSKEVNNFYGIGADGNESADSLGTQTLKSSLTWISLGGSYHFSQLEKLSPYVALDVMIGMGSSNEEWADFDGTGYSKGSEATVSTKESGLGVGVSAGFDYYFAENVFMGAELGFTYASYKDKGGEFSSGSTTVTLHPTGNENSFGNSATAAIRLGWRF
jgi:outer membrane protein W